MVGLGTVAVVLVRRLHGHGAAAVHTRLRAAADTEGGI